MRRAGLLWALLALGVSGETIQFITVARPVIEKRLGLFQGTNADRGRTLRDLFAEAGCPAERLTEQVVSKSKPPNVICTMPGELDSTIVVGAHFDYVSRGKGVLDNWSGASLLPSLFQSVNSRQRRHTFTFIGFTDEEQGLVGSRFYVRKLTKENLRKIAAMVNLDCIGGSTTSFETVRSTKLLTEPLWAVAATIKLPLSIVNAHKVGRSDSDTFQDAKVPSINIHSLTNDNLPILHSERDQMEAIQMNEYYDSYRLVAAYLAYLDLVIDPAAIE